MLKFEKTGTSIQTHAVILFFPSLIDRLAAQSNGRLLLSCGLFFAADPALAHKSCHWFVYVFMQMFVFV